MVLNWKEDESLRIVLKQGLGCLHLLDARNNLGNFLHSRLLCCRLDVGSGRVDDGGGVLFFSGLEAQLLDWRVHLQLLERSSSLDMP